MLRSPPFILLRREIPPCIITRSTAVASIGRIASLHVTTSKAVSRISRLYSAIVAKWNERDKIEKCRDQLHALKS